MSTNDREQFMQEAERIAEEVAAMSDEEVSAYIAEHNLEDLIDPERVDRILRDAMAVSRRSGFRIVK